MTIDPAKQAEELAQLFFELSEAVDAFRLRDFNTIPPPDQQRLKNQAQMLENRGQQFTADALGAILQGIQPHLRNIKQATQGAKEALKHLNNVAKAIAIVDSAVSLANSIVTSDWGSIGGNVNGLLQSIAGQPEK